MRQRRKKNEPKFYLKNLVKSKRYEGKRDILKAILNPLREYSLDEVDKLIFNFLNQEVK